ncbi:response regulator [soil metagenome]
MENQVIEILLVEDNLQDAEMTIRALKKSKLANNIVHVANGAIAIDFLFGTGEYIGRDINNKPKVILLDIKLPKINGIEVLSHIKSNQLTKRIPTVMLTSSSECPDIEKCYDLGANSYLVKPVEFENFMKSITDMGLYWLILNKEV